jgi:hypothetical protein
MLRIFLTLWLALTPAFAWAGSMSLLGVGTVNAALPTVTVLQAVTKSGNSWTFTFQRSGSTASSMTNDWAVSGSSLNGNPALASDFGGTFPSGTLTFSAGSATTTVTVTPTTNVEPN